MLTLNPIPSSLQHIWKAQDGPQTALIACPIFEVFYGGARGGGKTEGSLGDWIAHQAVWGEAAIGLFVRRKLTQLSEVMARARQIFKPMGAKWNEQQKTFTFPNGARLRFAYLERDSDAEEYQGHSYTRVYVEEATNFPNPGPIMKLKATLRSAVGAHCGMRLTGNPGGPGHNWVKDRYIKPCPKGYEVITEEDEYEIDGEMVRVKIDRVFIPSKIRDNPLLLKNDPTYIMRLKGAGGEQLVRAWLNGDWDAIEGSFFDRFSEVDHVLPTRDWFGRIPLDTLRFKAFDWGSFRPFSVGWYAVSDGTWGLPAGALLKYAEWYGSRGINIGLKMDAVDVAKGIVVRERQAGYRVRYGVGDPSIFIRNGGPSIGELMSRHGAIFRAADNKRQPGWEQMRWRLAGENDRPMLFFLDCCEDTIRTLPTLQHDDTNEEDLDTEGEDHAADETRYACMSRPWIPKALQGPLLDTTPFPHGPAQMTINQLIALQVRKRKAEQRKY